MTILVAFASRGSSTREVAERIAGRLRTCGHHVTLTPVTQAFHAGAYGAVVNWPEIDRWSDGIGRVLQNEAGDAKVRRAS